MQCPEPMIGNGKECSNDTDLDGYPDVQLTIGCNNQPVKACPVVSEWEREWGHAVAVTLESIASCNE